MATRYRDVMLDLETYGTGRDAAIASIGACRFDLEDGAVEDAGHFHLKVDLAKSKSPGTLTASTVEWWFKRDQAARDALVSGDRVPLENALSQFALWARASQGNCLWGNGANFDEVVLGDAFVRCGLAFPFAFYRSRCFRTLKEVVKVPEPPRAGTHHDALDDALHQARWALACGQALRARVAP